MNNKKIVGLLLAGSMLISSLTAFADVTLDKDADKEAGIPVYDMGDKITITTDNKEAVRVYKDDDDMPLVVWGVSKASADQKTWQYELQLPSSENEGIPTDGLWLEGETYIVVAGNNDSSDTTKFKIADHVDTTPTPTPAIGPVVYGPNGIVIQQLITKGNSRKWYDIFYFDILDELDYANSDDAEVEVEVRRGSSDISLGSTTYKLKYDDDTYDADSDMPIKTTVGTLRKAKNKPLSGYFYKTGTYYFDITVTDKVNGESWSNAGHTNNTETGDKSSYNVEFKLVIGSTSSGGSSGGGGTSINTGSTYVPTTTGGIEVALNPSQKTIAGQDTKVTYTASFVTPNSFTVGVNINGVAVTHFTGYDPVYVKVPYQTNVADTTLLVVKDQNGNIIPRSYYADGYMYVNLKDTNGVFTIVENPVSFDDVSHEWAKTQINALAARTILQGVGDNKFEPDRSVTRAEFMKMIIAMFDLEKSANASTFNDVDNSKWYAPYLATAQEMKITVGYEDGSFRPDNVISREEMSTMLYRASETLSVPIEAVIERTQFSDDGNIQDYAKVPVYKMQQARILQGVGDNRYDPQGECTRAQAAVAMYNMFVLSMKK